MVSDADAKAIFLTSNLSSPEEFTDSSVEVSKARRVTACRDSRLVSSGRASVVSKVTVSRL